ncbi:hypothetical protein C5B86_19385 [Haloferax sp. Atlit-19N]|uniref:hypothetical protein n=1 Tax=Haloferax sp. Atlit-19N TaxID=2077201 RepID=UPI000E27A41D|nr:hypothetical protein C5B86_19385 [Haloferax sp. Atlit-19N]
MDSAFDSTAGELFAEGLAIWSGNDVINGFGDVLSNRVIGRPNRCGWAVLVVDLNDLSRGLVDLVGGASEATLDFVFVGVAETERPVDVAELLFAFGLLLDASAEATIVGLTDDLDSVRVDVGLVGDVTACLLPLDRGDVAAGVLGEFGVDVCVLVGHVTRR